MPKSLMIGRPDFKSVHSDGYLHHQRIKEQELVESFFVCVSFNMVMILSFSLGLPGFFKERENNIILRTSFFGLSPGELASYQA